MLKPNYPASTSSRRGQKTYGRNQPAANANVPLASAIHLKNFTFLTNIAGIENIALGLDVPIQRVKEMLQGVNMSDETAYHIETTLGLKSGFLEHLNPQLTEEEIRGLRNPHERSKADEDVELAPVEPPKELPQFGHSGTLSVPVKTRRARKYTVEAPQASQISSDTPAVHEVVQPVPATGETSQAEAIRKPGRTRKNSEIAQRNAADREVRRQNLELLTSRGGAKMKLAKLLGVTATTISHQLHGRKRVESDFCNIVCEAVGLPRDWFETPRALNEIPENVWTTLMGEPQTAAVKKAGRPPAKAAQSGNPVVDINLALPPSALSPARSTAATPVSPAARLPATSTPEAPVSSAARPMVTPATVQLTPVVEAVIKTIDIKARSGELDDMLALEVLNKLLAR